MGKYMLLTQWLLKCPSDPVRLSYSELEDILGFKLPNSAYVHNRWWMNDSEHSQAQGWLDAGYITVDSNQPILTHTVEFSKNTIAGKNRPNKNKEVQPSVSIAKQTQAQVTPTITPESQDSRITIGDYVFYKTTFKIFEKDLPSPFLQYDGHTVNDLLYKKHYSSLRPTIESTYPQFLNLRIKSFMNCLVQNKDRFYLKFLNKNGNDTFCRFGLTDNTVFQKRGLYLYEYNGCIMYIGRCRDNYYTRFNINYGTIQPINCYKEGQSTNTHMNSLMNRFGNKISIYLCPLSNIEEIIAAEDLLIKQLQPEWNRKK